MFILLFLLFRFNLNQDPAEIVFSVAGRQVARKLILIGVSADGKVMFSDVSPKLFICARGVYASFIQHGQVSSLRLDVEPVAAAVACDPAAKEAGLIVARHKILPKDDAVDTKLRADVAAHAVMYMVLEAVDEILFRGSFDGRDGHDGEILFRTGNQLRLLKNVAVGERKLDAVDGLADQLFHAFKHLLFVPQTLLLFIQNLQKILGVRAFLVPLDIRQGASRTLERGNQ
jgi:hypothetical protein